MLFLGTEKYPEEGKYQKVFTYLVVIYSNTLVNTLVTLVYYLKKLGI